MSLTSHEKYFPPVMSASLVRVSTAEPARDIGAKRPHEEILSITVMVGRRIPVGFKNSTPTI